VPVRSLPVEHGQPERRERRRLFRAPGRTSFVHRRENSAHSAGTVESIGAAGNTRPIGATDTTGLGGPIGPTGPARINGAIDLGEADGRNGSVRLDT
jgi:hypothetical protein